MTDASQLLTYLQSQYKRITALESAQAKTNGANKPTNTSMNGVPLTQAQLNQIRMALQANGIAQMNVQSMLGVLAQVQNAGIPRVTVLPSPIDPLFQNSAAVVFSNVLYTNDGTAWIALNGGTVTSVAVSGGTTGLTTSGGPITTSGTITFAGTLVVANGGTGSTTAAGARGNLVAAKSGANTDITSLVNGILIGGAGGIAVSSGAGAPNGSVVGSVGDMYCDQTGTPGLVLYVKESGTATNLGWAPK